MANTFFAYIRFTCTPSLGFWFKTIKHSTLIQPKNPTWISLWWQMYNWQSPKKTRSYVLLPDAGAAHPGDGLCRFRHTGHQKLEQILQHQVDQRLVTNVCNKGRQKHTHEHTTTTQRSPLAHGIEVAWPQFNLAKGQWSSVTLYFTSVHKHTLNTRQTITIHQICDSAPWV